MQDNNREMHIVDSELYFVIDEKNNQIDLTEKGIQELSEENSDTNFFILPDIGNEIAKEIYAFTGTKLGQGLAQVATLLSPEAFIFYGGFSNAGHRILEPAKQSMDRHLINNHADDIKLLQSGLPQGQAGILGAASLIWSSLEI